MTSLLTWELPAGLTDVADLDWIAAIGLLGDLGDAAPFPMLAGAKKRYTAKYLKEAVALLNAARAAWSTRGAPMSGLCATPARRSRPRWKTPKSPPYLCRAGGSDSGPFPCQIHPLVAQIWRTRPPKFIVLAANDAYLPGRVNFSARAARGVNVLEFLRSVPLPPGEGNFGQGHGQASGGSLPAARWNALLAALGFSASVFASENGV